MRIPLLFGLAALLSTTVVRAAPDQPTALPAAQPARKKVIESGMTTAEISELFGRPLEIKPMKSENPATQAEQWIYRRKLKETTSSSSAAPGTMPTLTLSDPNSAAYTIHVPVAQYRLQRITTYQLTALLMVNGKLEAAKQWTEQTEAYD